jgi:hypothetical protein
MSFRLRLRILIGFAVFAFASAILQLWLGSDPLIVCGVLASLAAVALLVVWQPFAFGTWYAAYFFLQLYGIAWIVKSALLLRFESGLAVPTGSIGWSTVFILTTCGMAGVWHYLTPAVPRLERHYGDETRWTSAGVLLLGLGETAHFLAYVSNAEAADTFGGFDPLKRFSLAATCLLAAAAARKGSIFSLPLAIALGAGVIDALLFSGKSELFLRAFAAGVIIMTGDLPVRRKLIFGALLPVAFILMNVLIFPTIHATREIKNRNLPMNERITLVKMMLGQHGNEASYVKPFTGNIWNENVNFLPTDNWFLLRFGSVAYFDVTLKFSRPAAQKTSLPAFTGSAINQAFPLGLMGPKSPYSLADRLWYSLDSRIEPGGYLTMGAYASARLLFGNLTGLLVASCLIFLIGVLVVRFYGNDIRPPLVMYIFVGIAYSLIDGDLEDLVAYAVRFFWQDLGVLLATSYGLRLWARIRAQADAS